MDRIFVIMCGGYYEHFEDHKSMCVVNGEILVERTIKLLKNVGVSTENIYISSNDDKFERFGVKVLHHENTYRWEDTGIKGYWLDAFYPYFRDDTKVTYLYGDVYYTENAIKTIVECIRPGDILFGTKFAKNKKHLNRGEPFAFKVDDYKRFIFAVNEVKKMYDEGKLVRHPITWELYRYLNGFDMNIQRVQDSTYICIDDGTLDVDNPSSIKKIEEGLSK